MKKVIIAVVLCLLIPVGCFAFEVGDTVETTTGYANAMHGEVTGKYFSGVIVELNETVYGYPLATIANEDGLRGPISTFWIQRKFSCDHSCYPGRSCNPYKGACFIDCKHTTTTTSKPCLKEICFCKWSDCPSTKDIMREVKREIMGRGEPICVCHPTAHDWGMIISYIVEQIEKGIGSDEN